MEAGNDTQCKDDGAGGNVKALRHPRKLKPHAPRCGEANGARRRSLRMVRGYPVSINAHAHTNYTHRYYYNNNNNDNNNNNNKKHTATATRSMAQIKSMEAGNDTQCKGRRGG